MTAEPQPPSHVDDHAQRQGTLARAVRATSLMTLASRLGGLVRDVIIGRIFGDTSLNSAFNAAFAIPNMFRRLFGEGALSAAFIPEYTQTHKADPARADKLASLTMAALGAITGGLTVIAELVLLALIFLLPYDQERVQSLKLVMVMLPFMPLICMVAILAGMLQVHGKFGAAASGPIILNAFIIAVGLYSVFTGTLGGETTAYILGVATVLSGLTQLIYFLRLLRPHVCWTRLWSDARPQGVLMLKKFVPVAIGLGTLQLNTFLDTLLAMWTVWVGPTMFGRPYPLSDASNGILSLTARLYQFPLGVFGIAVATAAFPLLSRHAKEPAHFIDTLRRSLRLSLYIGLPATLGLILVRHDITSVMFGHGKTGWSPDGLARSAAVLAGFSVGIWAYSINQVFTRAFYAQGDTKTPMKISLAMILVNVALNLTLIWSLDEAGLAWATAISAVLQSIVLYILCARMLGTLNLRTPIIDAHFRRGLARILIASLAMGACVYAVMFAVPVASPLASTTLPSILRSDWAWQLLRLAIATGVGGASYLLLSRVLKIVELNWIMHRPR